MQTATKTFLALSTIGVVLAAAAPVRAAAPGTATARLDVGIAIAATSHEMLGSYQTVVHDAMRAGPPRERALAALDGMSEVHPATRTGELVRAATLARDDALVQWLVANRMLALGDDDEGVIVAERAARLEPDNAAAWALVLGFAERRGDATTIDAALARMAAGRRSDEHAAETVRAWLDAYERTPPPTARFVNAREGKDASLVLALSKARLSRPSYQAIADVCDTIEPVRAARCATAGRLMLNRATSLDGRAIGYAMLERSGSTTGEEKRAGAAMARWLAHRADLALRTIAPGESEALRADWRTLDDESAIVGRALERADAASASRPGPGSGSEMHIAP